MTFSLKVNPQPLDFINEANLRTFILAPVDDDKASPASMVIALAIVVPSVEATSASQGSLSRS